MLCRLGRHRWMPMETADRMPYQSCARAAGPEEGPSCWTGVTRPGRRTPGAAAARS